ncbi:MAG: hypothetical protein RLZZ04_81 [Cyanobacteriota bacterium]|jgi:hypothetical protein
MINWCKQNTLLLLITSSFWSGQSSGVSDSIVTKAVECHNVNTAYQEVYGFETENYYINICQLDEEFFYYRQSKLDASNKLLIPAESILRGDVFQATAGRTTYFVGIESDRYYSSVMSNNNEIVFEPEILPTAAIALKAIPLAIKKQSSLPTDYNLLQEEDKILSNTQMALDYPEAVGEDEQLLSCTQGGATIDFSITTNSTNANSGVVEQGCLPAAAKNVLNSN